MPGDASGRPAAARHRRFTPSTTTLFGTAVAVWGMAIGLLRIHDNSYLTHVATGRLILAQGFPHGDPYSFTAHGHSWTLESWLAEVLYGAVDRIGGGRALQLLHATWAAGLSVLVWVLTRPARTLPGRVIAAGAVLAVGTGYWSPRPLLLALAFFAVVMWLAEFEGVPWLALPLMWLWVQVHGSWPIAFGYVALRTAGRALDRRPVGRLPHLLAAIGVGTILGAANPFGFRLLAFPTTVVTHHQAFTHIVEWQSPSFAAPTNAIFLAEALLAMLLLVARAGSIEDGLVTVVFTAAACYASRDVPLAAVAMVPVLARGLSGLGTLRGDRRSAASLAGMALVTMLAGSLVAGAYHQPAFDLSAYPVREVSWMQARGLVPGRVATQDFVGNYLEYRYGARASAFIDDRVDMYPSAVEHAYGVLLAGRPSWSTVLDHYRVRTVLWARSQPLASLVAGSPHWRVVLQDHHWMVAVRR